MNLLWISKWLFTTWVLPLNKCIVLRCTVFFFLVLFRWVSLNDLLIWFWLFLRLSFLATWLESCLHLFEVIKSLCSICFEDLTEVGRSFRVLYLLAWWVLLSHVLCLETKGVVWLNRLYNSTSVSFTLLHIIPQWRELLSIFECIVAFLSQSLIFRYLLLSASRWT